MTLRRKLVLLHSAFAMFAVLAAAAAIYGVRIHVRNALRGFDRLNDQSHLVDQLQVGVLSQIVLLHDVAEGRRKVGAIYIEQREAFFTRMNEIATYASRRNTEARWECIKNARDRLQTEFEACASLASNQRFDEAHAALRQTIEGVLLPEFEACVQQLKVSLEKMRRTSVNLVVATDSQLFMLAGVIAMSCTVLIAAGAALVRRWLIKPIAELQATTNEFARGNLSPRIHTLSSDELGSLGLSLNVMAASLWESQNKYRSLFENLRDAVVICDNKGVVVECRDSDTNILGIMPHAAVGRSLLENWPEWRTANWDWDLFVARLGENARQIRAVDVELQRRTGKPAIVDVNSYPVEYGNKRYTAILLRDVTERSRLQRLVRRAETMEAAATFARGIAHDFKNLLHGAMTSLSLIVAQKDADKNDDRAMTALQACQQAARLSKRLSEFASSDEGNPQVCRLGEMVELILGSLDETFLARLVVETDCRQRATVRMDRDQLTQIILNLVYNAREAMPGTGHLSIATETTTTSDPVSMNPPSEYAVLSVSDTGCGMTPETKDRLFEPFYSTKDRDPSGRRGLGLAVVYAVVANARGFIRVTSEVGSGATFACYLPAHKESQDTNGG